MVRYALVLLGLTLILTLPDASAAYPEEPVGDWYLIDHGDVLTDSQEILMEQQLIDLQNSSGTLVRVVTISSMGDLGETYRSAQYFDSDDGYARGMYQYYGMEGGENKTILIAMSVDDRRFKFVMPDHSSYAQAQSQGVFDNEVAPYLSDDLWFLGLTSAIDGIEPYAADEFKMLPQFVFWTLLIGSLMFIPIVVRRVRTNFEALNYDAEATLFSVNRILKESILQRGITTFEAMDGDDEDDSKAKWELMNDINTIKEFGEDDGSNTSELSSGGRDKEFILDNELALYSTLRINKWAEDVKIPEQSFLELEHFEEDIDRINLHLSVMEHLRFGAYLYAPIIFTALLLVLNGFLKSSGLGIGEILADFNSWNGLYMIVVPFLIAGVYTFAATFVKPVRYSMSLFAAMILCSDYASNVFYLPQKLESIDRTKNKSNMIEISAFVAITSNLALEDVGLVSTGRDEFGNEMYDVHRIHDSGGSDGGGCGSSCGGGCGGGGCGGGGGF